MQRKRLYYIVAVHGGTAGTHSLVAGLLQEDEVITGGLTGVYRVLVPFVGDPGVMLELGTIAEPSLPAGGGSVAGPFDPYGLAFPGFGVWQWASSTQYATVTSPWAMTVTGGDLTDGLLELSVERVML